jgi:hypothetical protein
MMMKEKKENCHLLITAVVPTGAVIKIMGEKMELEPTQTNNMLHKHATRTNKYNNMTKNMQDKARTCSRNQQHATCNLNQQYSTQTNNQNENNPQV